MHIYKILILASFSNRKGSQKSKNLYMHTRFHKSKHLHQEIKKRVAKFEKQSLFEHPQFLPVYIHQLGIPKKYLNHLVHLFYIKGMQTIFACQNEVISRTYPIIDICLNLTACHLIVRIVFYHPKVFPINNSFRNWMSNCEVRIYRHTI